MQVFVYGTLTDPDRVAEVVEDWTFVGDAVLEGMHRVEGDYPTLAPGGSVAGRVLETPDVDRLDAYEGVDRGLYVRVPVAVAPDASVGSQGASFGTQGASFGSQDVSFGTPDGTDGDRGNSTERTVDVYVGDPAKLSVTEPVSWASDESGPGALEERVRAVAADCVVRERS